jgi:geranylgeranyl pyrophosphate synthase
MKTEHTFPAAALWRHLGAGPDVEPGLRAALAWVVRAPGKGVRMNLVQAMALRFGLSAGKAERLACGVEYFHLASLVLDDLPAMDDAQSRRGQPCVHRVHGEASAILAALTLINRGYALTDEALAAAPARVRRAARGWVDRCLGLAGLVGGQARDLAFDPRTATARDVARIAAAKTGALFALAVFLPAELGRPAPAERRALRALCVYWGQLYQLEDDVADALAAEAVAGKTTGRDRALGRPNLVHALGLPAARRRQARLAALLRRTLARLDELGGDRWQPLQAVFARPVAERSAA